MKTKIIKNSWIIIILILQLLLLQNLNAQTIKTVGGAGADYSSLRLAFNDINSGVLTGAITLQITGSTTETSCAILYGIGNINYTSVLIYPTGSGYEINGNLASSLIDIFAADNVTIDGRVNCSGSTKDLTITNTNTGTGSSTIRFLNSATNNLIRYCNIKGSETSTSKGIIYFYVSNYGEGNINNIIEYNDITSDSAGRVINAVYSIGTPGRDNTSNVIRNNNIFDVWRTSATSYSIQLSSYTSDWTITGNNFYETSNFIPTGNNTYIPIKISYSTGNGFIITDNYIGGQAPQCGGSALTINSSTANVFHGINLSVGTTTATSVQNNTIKNINFTSSSTGPFQGIVVSGGNVDIGTITGNTIGSSTGTGSITVTSSVTLSNVYGINFGSSGTINCNNNIIGSFTIGNSNNTYSTNFLGINRTNTSTSTINNNLIGSTTTSNSIQLTSQSTVNAQTAFGFKNTSGGTIILNNNTISNISNFTTNSSTGALGMVCGIISSSGAATITNNSICNLSNSNANSASSASSSVLGIALTSTNALNTIGGNHIYNLTNSYDTFTGSVIGIYFGSTGMYTSVSHTVTENFIHNLSITGASSTNASIYGIKINTGQTTYGNNIISLGGNTPTTIYGIYEYGSSTNNNSIYFNTIYINGNLNSGVTNKSYALFSNVTTNVRDFRNNILMNNRSTTSGSNLHYALYLNYSTSTNLTADYNDYYVTGTGGVLGYYANTNKTSLPILTGQDVNSNAVNPVFVNPGGTSASDYYSTVSLAGVSGTGITTDFYGVTRNTTPKIGALEGTAHTYTWQGNISSDFGNASNWEGGVVPPDGADISFASSPSNNCVLDQNRVLGEITNSQGTYFLILNGKQLTLTEGINFSNGAKINATASSSVVIFNGTMEQNIPTNIFVNNIVDGLTINNSNGVILNNDLTVQQSLTLTSGNFNLGMHTLTVNGPIATTSGELTGGSSTNLLIGGTGTATIPSVVLNNLTINRSGTINLSGSLSISGTLNLTSGTLNLGTNTLTISGNSITRTSGNIDAGNSSANLIFSNLSAITLPASLFTGSVSNLKISGTGGLTASSDITISGILNLESSNPSSTKGSLDMGVYTLNMGSEATTTGIGDVEGIVRREHTFNVNTQYTFGSQYTTFNFSDYNTKPTWIICKISIGSDPGWSGWTPNGKIKRYYNVACSNNSSTSQAVINMRYLPSELDATYNDESKLVFWHKYVNFHENEPHEHGKSTQDFINHTIGVTGIIFGMAATTDPNESEVAIAYSMTAKNTWKGEVSGHQTEWGQTQNWTAGVVPTSTSEVLIPSGLNYYPSLTEDVNVQSIEILSGASINANSYNITVYGAGGSWINNGTFNAGTGKVMFNHGVPSEIVTISGTTDFYNIECGENTTMQPVSGCTLRIAGNGTAFLSSIVDFSTINNTVEYNGANQTIVNPNGIGGNSGYYNLIFSGSGTKTMPVTTMNVNGSLTISGSASVTANSGIIIKENFTINVGSNFNTGTYNHTIGGYIENYGTFTSQTGQTITMNGASTQWVGGTNHIPFYNLTVNNSNGVTIYSNVRVNNSLSLTSGNLNVGGIRGDKNVKSKTYKTNDNDTRKSIAKSTKQTDNLLEEDYQLVIYGNLNFSNGSKIDAKIPTSTIEFAGTTLQTIPDGAFVDNIINKLTINNTVGVTFEGNITINNKLTLTNGLLDMGTHTLTFGPNAEDPAEKSTSRIIGTAKIQDVLIGTGSFSFLSCYIGSGTDDLGHITIDRKTGSLGVISINGNNSIQSNWDITTDYPPVNGRNVEYRWLSNLDNGKTFTSNNKALNYFSTNNGTTWNLFGDPVDVSATNPRVMNYTTNHFSKWVATDQNSPLPVTLTSISSTVKGRNVLLKWATTLEINNAGFEIERKMTDGIWNKIGFVESKGNNGSSYTYEDRFLTTGKYLYRLRQRDYNGNYEYFNLNGIVEVGVPAKYDLSQNYPNPFNPVTKINFELPYDSKVSIIIYDITGREIKTLINENKTAGYYTQIFDASGISSGTYFYRITANSNGKDYIATKKMVLIK